MVQFSEFLKPWSLRSKSVTRQKLVNNANIKTFKWDILSHFKHSVFLYLMGIHKKKEVRLFRFVFQHYDLQKWMNETCRVVVCVRELFPDENGAKLTSVVVVVGGAGQQHFGRGCLSWLYLLHYYTDKNQGQSYAHSAKTYYYLHQEDSSSPSKIANKFIIFSATYFVHFFTLHLLEEFFAIFKTWEN